MLDAGARGATVSFAQKQIGDVLLNWENELWLAQEEFGADKFDIVYPSTSILTEPPVAVVDKVVDQRGTRAVAEAYLKGLYSPEAQDLAGQLHYRPRDLNALKKYSADLPNIPFHRRRNFWGLDQGPDHLLRRRRRLRQDLQAGELSETPSTPPSVPRLRPSTNSWLGSSRVIPGFPLTLGYTLFYLSALVLIPLAALGLKTAQMSLGEFWRIVTDPIVVASYRLTFSASFIAAVVNGLFGLIIAWSLVRYEFPFRRFFDALIDFPFALPTAVAGLTYASLYQKDGWIGGLGPHLVTGVNAVAAGWRRPALASDALDG